MKRFTQTLPSPTERAFSLVEIMIVVAILGILLAIAVPGFLRHRAVSQARACQENLRMIDEAKETYALEASLEGGAPVTWEELHDASNRERSYLDRGMPFCPSGGEYTLNPISAFPTCSLGAEDILDGSDALQHRIVGVSSGGEGS